MPARQRGEGAAPLVERLPAALVVASGAPHLGGTTTAGLVALAAYDAGASVLLVDAAGDWGRAHGVSPVARLFGARAAVPEMTQLPLADRFALWAGAAGAAALTEERRTVVCDATRGYDLVVLDAGWQLATIQWATRTLVACALDAPERTPAALLLTGDRRETAAATYAAAKVIRGEVAATPLGARGELPIAVTTARVERARGAASSRSVADACDVLLGLGVRVVAGLPDDPILPRAIGGGMSLADSTDGSATRRAAAELAAALLPVAPTGARAA